MKNIEEEADHRETVMFLQIKKGDIFYVECFMKENCSFKHFGRMWTGPFVKISNSIIKDGGMKYNSLRMYEETAFALINEKAFALINEKADVIHQKLRISQ
jgi:hypothetical protein